MGWLDGKTALIVGGGGGIGRAAVDGFLEEGASVGVLELDADRCDELGGRRRPPGVRRRDRP